MAVTVNREYVINQMKKLKLPYFSITDGGKSVVAQNQDSDDVEDAVSQVEDAFGCIEDSVVTIKLSDAPASKRAKGGSNFQFAEFRVNLKKKAESGEIGIAGIGIHKQYMETIKNLEMEIHQLKADAKLKALEDKYDKKFEELKKDQDENPVVKQLLAGLPAMMPHIFGKQTMPVAGIEDQPLEADTQTQQSKDDRIRAALLKLKKIDPQFIETLELIAEFATLKPDEYKSFVPILKSQL